MPSFKDTNDREWLIALDAPLIELVREECKLDLVTVDGSTQAKLIQDDVLLVNVGWRLCRSQAIAKDIDERGFKAHAAGDVLDDLYEAIWSATQLFIPARKRAMLQAIVSKQVELVAAATNQVLTQVNELIPEELLTRLTRLNSVTSGAGSVVLPPKEEPSANSPG